MDITRVTPFIQSVHHVFETMLQLPVEVGEPQWMGPDATPSDVSVVAGMSGDCEGSVALGLDRETAERVIALFTGTEAACHSPVFADAVSELFCMICGGAKAWLPGRALSISIPTVEFGTTPMAAPARNGAPVIVLPCATDYGQFLISLSLEEPAEAADRGGRAVCAGA
ncbi:MAG: chemotaxis protein CheX [Phycisphaera sp.]|nr:MAG: chemotaxis protein CheX [Phycisphaera sp.]